MPKIFYERVKRQLNQLSANFKETALVSNEEVGYFLLSFFEKISLNFETQLVAVKSGYKYSMEGKRAICDFDPSQLSLYLKNEPLSELEYYFQRGESSLEAHTFICTCNHKITADEDLVSLKILAIPTVF